MSSYNKLDKKWLDYNGNIKPNSWQIDSENPTHFNVQYFFTVEHVAGGLAVMDVIILHNLIQAKWATQVDKQYRTNERDNNNSFSLDESIAVAAACKRYYYPINIKKLRVVTKQTWFRFYDVIPYLLLCKYPGLKYLGVLQLLVSFFALLSCLTSKRSRSTGRRKVYVMCRGLNMKRLYKLCEKANRYRGSSFKDSAFTYFPEAEHPIVERSKQMEG